MQQSEKLSTNAVCEAKQAHKTMEQLSDSANRIGQILVMINEMANQTNPLALNATIEAARAWWGGEGLYGGGVGS